MFVDDRRIASLEARSRNLAVLFGIAVEGEVARERVATWLWGDREPRKARQSLSEALYELKKDLGEWCSATLTSITVSPQVELDVAAFQAAVAAGDDMQVFKLYRGHFLEDLYTGSNDFDAWVEHRRRSLFSEYRTVATRVIREVIAEEEYRAALLRARDWVEIENLDDEAQHYLVACLALCGDRVGALAQFETYSTALKADDLIPLDRTLALRTAITDGDIDRVLKHVDLSPADQGDATSRGTSLWWPNKGSGPRLLLIDRPDASDGTIVWLQDQRTSIGPADSEIPIPGGEERAAVQVERVEGGGRPRFVLRATDESDDVFLLLRGPRPLYAGDVVQAGEQRFRVLRDRVKGQ